MTLNIRKQSQPVLNGISILLYGMPKIGKTTEASKFPNALLLNCEPSGTDLLQGEHDVLDVPSLQDLEKMLPEIEKSEYKTIVLDGFTWMVNQAATRAALATAGSGRQKGLRGYAEVTQQTEMILGRILTSGKMIVATGHSRLIDDTESDNKVEVRPDVNPALSDSIFGLFSIIAYCFLLNDSRQMLTKSIDNNKRRILAGDRSGKLPERMKLDAHLLMDELRKAVGAKPKPVAQAQPQTPKTEAEQAPAVAK